MRSELAPGFSALGSGRALSVPEPSEVWRYSDRLAAGYSGIGRGPTERVLEALAGEVDGVLHMGVAGGLRAGLDAGAARLVERAFHGEQEATWETPADWRPALAGLASGAILTVDAVAGKPHQKRALGEAYDAQLVDMETFWAARKAQALGLPFAAVRVVCDTVDDDLPDLSQALDRVGRPRPLKMLGRLARKPSSLASLPRMASAFGTAQKRLGELIGAVAGHMTQV